MKTNLVSLTRSLLQCPSVTPNEAGCFEILSSRLQKSGFGLKEINRGKTKNLWAAVGAGAPHLLFAGHVDVVPPGEGWSQPPYGGIESESFLYGRGAQDMKSSVAAFTEAACRFISNEPNFKGTISLLITSDEEGDGADGTKFALEELMKGKIPAPDFCIVGEPSCCKVIGDTIKNGRRGSLNAKILFKGIQGHVAYPEKLKNAIHAALAPLAEISSLTLDEGTETFPPSSLQISNIHAGNGAVNVAPGICEALLNIRFNTQHTPESLKKLIEGIFKKHGTDAEIIWTESALPFQTQGARLIEALSEAIKTTCRITPALSTSGGTSDARFIRLWCPEVAEFGPCNDRIHKVDERIPIRDLCALEEIYHESLQNIFLKAD